MAHAWKACWVQALGGSNPPSSATQPRKLPRLRGFVACGAPRTGLPGSLPTWGLWVKGQNVLVLVTFRLAGAGKLVL